MALKLTFLTQVWCSKDVPISTTNKTLLCVYCTIIIKCLRLIFLDTTYRLLLVQNRIIALHYFDHISITNKKPINMHYLTRKI